MFFFFFFLICYLSGCSVITERSTRGISGRMTTMTMMTWQKYSTAPSRRYTCSPGWHGKACWMKMMMIGGLWTSDHDDYRDYDHDHD